MLAQPDGSSFRARLFGDEWRHWYETEEGYTILQDAGGTWVYAASVKRELLPSSAVVGVDAPPTFAPTHLRSEGGEPLTMGWTSPARTSILGTAKVVVILIDFTDTPVGQGSKGPRTASFYGDPSTGLIFGSNQGKMKHYYNEVSYGQLTIDGVIANDAWHTSSHTMAFYGADCNPGNCPALAGRNLDNCNVCINELAREAVQKADAAGFDFAPYDENGDGVVDHVMIVHAGHDQAQSGSLGDIWSHRYGIVPGEPVDGVEVWGYTMLSEFDAMSVFAHEFMHDLGAPDLYDRNSSNTLPMGDWCLMSTFVKSDQPPLLCGLLKYDLNASFQDGISGWAATTQLTSDGTYSIGQSDLNQSGAIYVTPAFPTNEFFVLENRQRTGYYDSSVPEAGIIITHVDADYVDGSGRITNDDPYGAWIERPGNDGTSNDAAYSSEDGATEFSPSTVPSTNANGELATGLSFSGIGSESSTMSFKYATPPAFTDVTSEPLGGTGSGFGVAWADYDGDGDDDLYVANGNADKLLRNDGGGVFADATAVPLGDPSNGRGVAWADYDNDGDLDLYVANYSAANKLYRNDGGGTFTDVTSGPLGNTGRTHNVVWGDYDNDGDIDLYMANEGQANKLLRNDGGGVFTDVTSGVLGDTGKSIAAAWGDYDNDGDLDLYFTNWMGGFNRLMRNNGGGTFTDVTSGPLVGNGWGTGVAWGDYDNDLDLDLYIVNHDHPNMLLRNDGGGTFTNVTNGPLGISGAGRGVIWTDFDNDGDLDLYIAYHENDRNRFLRNDGADGFVDVTSSVLGATGSFHGTACADYDQDGDVDIYVANAGGASKLLRNDQGSAKHWLRVRLVGTSSNRSAIGARVRIVAGGTNQLREISGGSGFCSQNSLTTIFGLGTATHVDSLEVRWPSGLINTKISVVSDNTFVVTEGAPTAVGDHPGTALSFSLRQNYPNPFNPSTTIAFELPRREAVSLTIYDVGGRKVRSLLIGDVREPGTHHVEWNGRDDGGGHVASGVYFCQLVTGAHRQSIRLVLLK
jgi:M6 family metalloprotease-like protein